MPLDVKNQLIGKNPDAEKDWGQEENGAIEDEIVGRHHWINGHELEQTWGDSEGQGSLDAVDEVAKSQTWLNNWRTENIKTKYLQKKKKTKYFQALLLLKSLIYLLTL